METREKDKIRDAVREAYGQVARSDASLLKSNRETPCCGPSEISAESSRTSSYSCCGADVSLDQISHLIGYSSNDIHSVPEGANMGLGCGNPVTVASLKPGETVVDLGSGGGFDCFLAAKQVGATGRVNGVDMTADMISKARQNAEKIKAQNVEFRLGEIEHLPVADNSVDIIMSNCVINLSPDKQCVYQDAHRILKPGGRLAISDIVATAQLSEEIKKNLDLVSACIGGAATIEDTHKMLKNAGFQDVKITPNENSRKLIREWIQEKSEGAGDYVVSAQIEARKPFSTDERR